MLNAEICCLNSQYIHSSLAPWCLLAGVKKYADGSARAYVTEGTVNEAAEVLAERITAGDPDVIGFCCYIWNISTVRQLLPIVRAALPEAVIVLGGPEVSYNAAEVLSAYPEVDFVISGEGEKPFAKLLDSIANDGEAPDKMGICARKNGSTACSEPYISDEEPPSPYCDEYFAALGGRIAYIETSRGCPYSCAFCLSGRCGKAVSYEMSRAKNDILLLASKGAKTIKFVDRTFNADRSRAKEILRFIISEYGAKIPEGVCFHFEIAGDILDSETVEILLSAQVGAIQLEIGMQSFNEKTLAAVNRKTDTQRLEKNIMLLTAAKKRNMHIHTDLIAGLPYEDFNSFADSFNRAYSLGADMLQMGFLKLLHGADMREQPEKYPCSFSKEPPYEVISTPWLSQDELSRLHRCEDALDRLYNSGRFRRTLSYVLSRCEMKPFDLFMSFGMSVPREKRFSLDEYTAMVFDFLSSLSGVDRGVLRDEMVCDRFATNSFGLLPEVLKIKEPVLLQRMKGLLEADPATSRKKGVKRSTAILYSRSTDKKVCGVYADYREGEKKNAFDGEYKINIIYFDA